MGSLVASKEQRGQLVDIFSTEVVSYLRERVDPTVPLEDQASVLAQMAADLPACRGWCPYSIRPADPHNPVVTVDLDAIANAELLIVPDFEGAPLLYARHSPTGWRTIPIPVRHPWHKKGEVVSHERLFALSAETRDVTGDGQPEGVTVHWSPNMNAEYVKYPQIWRWSDEGLSFLFRTALIHTHMSGEDWHFEPYGTGHDIVTTFFGPKDGFVVKETRRWRWDPAVDRYVLWSLETRPPLGEGGAALWAGDCEAALRKDEAFLVNNPIPESRSTLVLTARDRAHLRIALCHALLNESDAARQALNAVETGNLRRLARAFDEGYGDDANLPAALAAYEQARQPAHYPQPYVVLALLNAANDSGLLDSAINEYGMPVQVFWADLDGDGQEEIIWLSEAAWDIVCVGWQGENGLWQATGVVWAVAGELVLEDVTPSDQTRTGEIIVYHRDEHRTFWWDGKLKMARIPRKNN